VTVEDSRTERSWALPVIEVQAKAGLIGGSSILQKHCSKRHKMLAVRICSELCTVAGNELRSRLGRMLLEGLTLDLF
jgi:hypothetical protein